MRDSLIKGTGNSRYLKSAIGSDTTWQDALSMLRGGTFPIDFNGVNPTGFDEVGTPLNKATILTDELAEYMGLSGNPTLVDFLTLIANLLTVNDERDGKRYTLSLSVNEDGYPALTFTEVA